MQESELFNLVSDFIKSFQYSNAINLLNKNLESLKDQTTNQLKFKIILILGKLYIKIKNVDIIIKMVSTELNNEKNEISENLRYSLISLLYRCFHLKSNIKSIESSGENKYSSKIITNHPNTLTVLGNKLQSKNTSDMVLSRNRSVEMKFDLRESIDPEKEELSNENKSRTDESYQFFDDLNIKYYLYGEGISNQFQIPIKSIACGRYFSMVLDVNGMIWNWGFDHEVCSNTQRSPRFPHPITKSFKSIAAGHHHCVAVTSDGIAYGWGVNNFGAVGTLSSDAYFERTPKQISFKDTTSDEVVKVSAGAFNSAFITRSGKLYVCGRNDRFQLGITDVDVDKNGPLPTFSNPKEKNSYIPSILVSSSAVTRDYSYFINSKQYSDLYISFADSDIIVYCHIILLSSLGNQKLLLELEKLKSTSAKGIVEFEIQDFLKFVHSNTVYTDGTVDLQNMLTILAIPTQDNNHISNSTLFIDFISFVYTNTTTKRYESKLRNYSRLFACKQLNNYLSDDSFNTINEASDLKIGTNLLSHYNNEFLSDCQIVSPGDSLTIKSHRVILSARSTYFKKLLDGSGSSAVVKIPKDAKIKDTEIIPIVAYLYCDRIKFDLVSNVTGDYVLALYASASEIGLNRFKEGLLKLISQSVTVENAVSLLNWSKKATDAQSLEKFIYSFISLQPEFHGTEHYSPNHLPFPFRTSSARSGQYYPLHVVCNETFIDVSVGAKLMLALTNDNKLYQLGYGSDRKKKQLQLVTLPDEDAKSKIKKISCGSSHWIVVTETNNIYGWGCGDLNQIVDGSRKFCFSPTLIYSKNEFNNAKAGFYASMFWTDLSDFPLPNNVEPVIPATTVPDREIQIDLINTTKLDSLWFFKNYDSTSQLLSELSINDNQNTITTTTTTTTTIKSSILNLPPLLFDMVNEGKLDKIELFGFGKETIEKFLSISKVSSVAKLGPGITGDQALELLFLSTSFGNYNLSLALFELFKKSLNDLTHACLLLNCIHNSNYSLQFNFLFNYLLGYLSFNRFELFKNNNLLNSISKDLLQLIIN